MNHWSREGSSHRTRCRLAPRIILWTRQFHRFSDGFPTCCTGANSSTSSCTENHQGSRGPFQQHRDRHSSRTAEASSSHERERTYVLQTETDHATQKTEEYQDEDEVDKTKIEAKNGLKNHCVTVQSTSIVEKMKSKFEVGHKKVTEKIAHARNRLDKNQWRDKHDFEAKQKGPHHPQDAQERADMTNQRQGPAIQSVQKTVEVPKVQCIDKVADIVVDVKKMSTTQTSQHDMQHIDEVVHVPALVESEVPTVPDTDDLCLDETADEDRLEQESKKRKLVMPAEAVSDSRADESDFDRLDDLVLPSPEGKTLFMNIASDDETEDGPEKEQEMTRSLVQGGESMLVDETEAQGQEHKMIQVVRTEWAQELREVRKKSTDDVASEMTDVKNDLAHVRELLGVLVRRERCAETKVEIAARRLDRME